ncbi:Asp-tRNA(Asn)/Glu-tRNA(Gln) amidotransferase subunit GatC [Patescibacteria group bacterium]|nr:MAG: Asp-tRNA(Asn)/Glu-tRNA(Gln) amidotransferase subunit GatC [Patescibacteria group bacterium]
MIKREDIDKLAALARLRLSEEEKETFFQEIDSILSYVAQVQKVSLETKEELAPHLSNVLRKDVESHPPAFFTESLLAQAPELRNNFIKVKRILGSLEP